MSRPHVLIVEDDADINGIVATHLTRCGYACAQAFSGTEARLMLEGAYRRQSASEPSRQPRISGACDGFPAHDTPKISASARLSDVPELAGFDVIICDLMLPDISGEELVALIRSHDTETPIVVTSARTAASDKIDLLKLGADDYLAKPFDLDELTARIEVQLRHRQRVGAPEGRSARSVPSRTLTFRSWVLDPDARTFTVKGEEVCLTRIDFNIVEVLMRHRGRVFSKQELFEQAWGEPYAADDNTVTVHVSNIRAKLKASGTDGYIKTVWGMGFKLVED